MSTDLKRLGFVQSSTSLAYTEAEKLYRTLRSYAPQFVASSLEKVEGQVTATAAPYVTIAQDRCDQLLKMADSRVDTLVSTADKTISRSKSGVSLRLQAVRDNVQAASDSYLQLVSKAADYVVDKLHVKGVQAATLKAVEAARDSLQSAVATAREATSDPDAAVRIASDAWANFAALPAVHKLLDTAAPATKIGVLAFNTLHDNLVSNRAYKMVVDSTAGTLTFATSTTPYKLGAHYVYPLFQPYADPAIAKVTHSKVINDVFEYWKPAATAAITAH